MERLEFSFRNRRVKLWFLVMSPAILLTILLFMFLPNNYYVIPTVIPIVAMTVYWGGGALEKHNSKTTD